MSSSPSSFPSLASLIDEAIEEVVVGARAIANVMIKEAADAARAAKLAELEAELAEANGETVPKKNRRRKPRPHPKRKNIMGRLVSVPAKRLCVRSGHDDHNSNPNRRPPEHIERVMRGVRGPVSQNIAHTYYMCTPVVSEAFAAACMGEHSSKNYASSCVIRSEDMHGVTCTHTVCPSSSVVFTGMANPVVAQWRALRETRRILDAAGCMGDAASLAVTNVMATAYIGWKLDMAELNTALIGGNSDMSKIKNISYTVAETGVTVLIYGSGRLVLTGATEPSALSKTVKLLVPFLAHFTTVPAP